MPTRKVTTYDQLNVPKAHKFLERLDKLCRLIERDTGVLGVQRWAAAVTAVDEAIEKRSKSKG